VKTEETKRRLIFILYNVIMAVMVIITITTAIHYRSFNDTCEGCIEAGICERPTTYFLNNNEELNLSELNNSEPYNDNRGELDGIGDIL